MKKVLLILLMLVMLLFIVSCYHGVSNVGTAYQSSGNIGAYTGGGCNV